MSDVGTAFCMDCGQSREVRSIAGSNYLEPPCPCKEPHKAVPEVEGTVRLTGEPAYSEVFQNPHFRFFPDEDWAPVENFPVGPDTKRVSFPNTEPGDQLVMTLEPSSSNTVHLLPNGEGDYSKAIHERDVRIADLQRQRDEAESAISRYEDRVEELETKYALLQRRHSELHKKLSGEVHQLKKTYWSQTRVLEETRALLHREREHNTENLEEVRRQAHLVERLQGDLTLARQDRGVLLEKLTKLEVEYAQELATAGVKEHRPGANIHVQSQYDLED